MVSRIGPPDLNQALQALERKGIRISGFTTSDKESGEEMVLNKEALQDWVDVRRDGDLDPESLQLIDQILAGENE
ncbi:hypothetical protein [Bdellovibrio sp. HCB337]|uniref:hypothetical protein n=1 Tax=Bdellovibrio sp. HCB337 TaxID=3394358 RepID=UPI0039A4CA0E